MQRADALRRLLQRRIHGQQHGVVGRAQIDAEPHPARDHVARVRVGIDPADGAAPVRRLRERDAVDLDHQFGSGQQRVVPKLHRGGTGMRFHALHHHVVPALAERALHHADHALVGFQHRPLLDVRFEVRTHG